MMMKMMIIGSEKDIYLQYNVLSPLQRSAHQGMCVTQSTSLSVPGAHGENTAASRMTVWPAQLADTPWLLTSQTVIWVGMEGFFVTCMLLRLVQLCVVSVNGSVDSFYTCTILTASE